MRKVLENIEVIDVGTDGKSIGKKDGKTIFIKGAVPGDFVDVQVHKKRKSYLEGTALHFRKLSKERATPFCNHFGTCGGCKRQDMTYSAQLKFKEKKVVDSFTRIGNLDFPEVNPIIGSSKTQYYRNKLEFTFSNKRWLTAEEIQQEGEISRQGLGFHMPGRFDRVVDIQHCYLQPDPSNEIRKAIKAYAIQNKLSFFDLRKQEGFLRNVMLRNNSKGDFLVLLSFFEEKKEEIQAIAQYLAQKFPKIVSLQYTVNNKKNDSIYDLEIICQHGLPYLEEQMGDFRFRIGPKSFFQTNTDQAHLLYSKALDALDLKGHEVVFDLYSGIGSIAIFAARSAKKVIGVESIAEAVDFARQNKKRNGTPNVAFVCEDVKEFLYAHMEQKKQHPDVIVVDPPRAGLHAKVVEYIGAIRPEKLLYISCNPDTQARDLALLKERYQITYVQPVDLFPHTDHIENIALLLRKDD